MEAGNKQLLSALLAQLETKDKQIEILLSTNAELVQEIKRVVSEKDAILAAKLPTTVIASSAANGKSPTPKSSSAHPTQGTPASLPAEVPKPQQKAPQKSQQTTTAKPNATVNGSTEDLEGAEASKRKGKRKVSDLAADSSPKVAPQQALEVKLDAQSKQPAKKKKKGSETQTKGPIPVDAYDLLFRLNDSIEC